ncbi:hypothetical protein M6D93_11520 [Jatrophihabitans telluris]|uniref:Integral membrane protein n=1 Tax=Jatrophihabitans telluris TaxID=2038343 RepID=A0ABY4QVD3_9ACTN|nr:hypothetical protein [Jatrophihabitans telluris]UQX86934.1 hypothetical protein M6D93_11520 [Jatrophihabitans telluris]
MRAGGVIGLSLRVLVAAGLLVDAVIHLQLAPIYQLAAPGGIGQGNLFRIESVAAILAALYVLARGSRVAFAAAFLVAGGGLAAVLLYRYVQVPALGPIPAMYEPLWFAKKTATAVAEAAASAAAVAGLLRTWQSTSTD